MIEELARVMREHGATPVTHIGFEDLVLSFGGEGWNGHTLCPWRITSGVDLVCGSETPEASATVTRLLGERVVGIDRQAVLSGMDPAVRFESGLVLEIFSDVFAESWVLGPNSAVHVGSPGDPRYSSVTSPATIPNTRAFGAGVFAAVDLHDDRSLRIRAGDFGIDIEPAWRLTRRGLLVTSSVMADWATYFADLSNRELRAVGRQAMTSFGVDPSVLFADGWAIEVFSESETPNWKLL